MSQTLYIQLDQFQNKIQGKLLTIETKQEKNVYVMLGKLMNECHELLNAVKKVAQTPSCQAIISSEFPEGESIVEETLAILEGITELPFKQLISKKVYETIEEQMADLDDWIETLNESLEHSSYSFPYIESWDIGVFLESR